MKTMMKAYHTPSAFLFFLLVIAGGFTLLLHPADALAKDYEIPALRIVAEIRPSGEVFITEERTFRFEGSYSWFEQDIRKLGFREIREIEVREGGQQFRFEDSNEPGTYSIRDGNRVVTIRTNFSAQDESRTFTLSYILEGALASDGEWAEFYWAFLGSDWDRAHQNIEIEIVLPEGLSADELIAWPETRAQNAQLSTESNRVLFTAERNRGDRALRIRTFFPERLVENTVPSEATLNPFVIMQEREEAELRKARMSAFLIPLGWVLAAASLVFAMVLVLKFGGRPQLAEHFPEMLETPPSEMPPAMVGWLFRNLYSDHNSRFVATIFDLSRKGYFRIVQEREETGTFRKKETEVYLLERTGKTDYSGLKSWETEVVTLLEGRLNGEKKRLNKLFDFSSKEHKAQTAFTTWWSKWFSEIGLEARANNWMVDNTKPIVLNMLVQAMLFLFGFFLLIYNSEAGPASGVALLIASGLALVLTIALNVRTEEGERVYRRWKAYRLALTEGRVSMKPELKGLHIVYAIALGLNKKKMGTLIESINPQPDDLTWMFFMPGFFPNAALFSNVVHTAVVSTTTSISTGTGAVGGAAGGGGGGRAG
ncbi:MAG: DUF2207 domain-containing protein [Candidatus Cyclonatronum sp.]|uniref:DUF2207 domain-containing protein n=1 Tax=Cyclonatronum sp. TaxID=3024185 RepID=UPI0025C5B408|nr:DUF2207 domain-containing protein [Cyclonatronum sp.]MCH8487715.1 DUF2207 domain-containing protein [Cyclonatronum sp.]